MSGSDYHSSGQYYNCKWNNTMKILHLVLKAKYFHRIYNKTKTTEYRDLTPYWSKRFEGKHFTHIKFQLAYSKNPPTMLVEILNRQIVDYKNNKAYAFDLGIISDINNYPLPLDE